jgi:hypothetical protein
MKYLSTPDAEGRIAMTRDETPCSACGRDRPFCLVQGWMSRRRADGAVEVRFTCPALDLRIVGPRSGAVAWTLAVAGEDGGAVVRERGYTRRLLDAARDLAEALGRAGLAAWTDREAIAVAIVVAESRSRRALAQPPPGAAEREAVDA